MAVRVNSSWELLNREASDSFESPRLSLIVPFNSQFHLNSYNQPGTHLSFLATLIKLKLEAEALRCHHPAHNPTTPRPSPPSDKSFSAAITRESKMRVMENRFQFKENKIKV